MLVGKTGFGPSCKQDDINALMVSLAKQGKRVVRLKGGDPLIFARAGEEIDACRAAGIAVDVVPGITAAQGAAARLGMPLTDRKHARRLQYITGHAKDGGLPDDIDWTEPRRSRRPPRRSTCRRSTLAALVERAVAEASIRRRRRSRSRVPHGPIRPSLPARSRTCPLASPRGNCPARCW